MKDAERRAIIAAPSIAYFSGYGGIEIKSIEYGMDDYIVFVSGAWMGDHAKTVCRSKIRYDKNGGAYFTYRGAHISLDDCIRM